MLDRLKQSADESYGVFDGLSCWMSHIIEDIEGIKSDIPAAERATIAVGEPAERRALS